MCGAPLAAEPAVAREERKVVTVFFCDLVGFTAKAEQLDPEDVRAILGPYHERVRLELERHGGTVEKFIGDAVMALFGAPTAHEDDPERAVRAALAIRDFAVEEGLELRVGVTTGEALVSLGASPSEGEGMASGDVVNTAARLQSAAPVNGILADGATYRATRQAVDYREAAAVEAKGKAEPIAVWEATSARSRFGVDVVHARTLRAGGARARARDSAGRVRARPPGAAAAALTLVGVPGMGKSRLVYELSRIVDADPELVTWRQGRCLAYGDGVAFWALAEVVKAQAGISERDSEAEAAEKLHLAVEDAVDDAGDARWVESHLRPLVGLETDTGLGGDRRGEAFAAWRRFLEALAEQRPLVLVLEDLHWADEGLLDFVDELVDWLSGIPLLVVCSARPELLERRPGWGGGQAQRLDGRPLPSLAGPDRRAHLARPRALAASGRDPAGAARAVGGESALRRAVRAALPRTRLGGGPPAPRDAAGHRRRSHRRALGRGEGASPGCRRSSARSSGPARCAETEPEATPLLHSLERKGFLTRQRRSSVESEGEWAFAHMLLRDVAYGQIPRADRAQKHRATAEWIESLGRADDHAELLAFHWSSALELARAAGHDTAKLEAPCRLALRAAGDRSFAVNAYPAAAAYYGDALALWPKDDDERPHLLYRYADALYIADDDRAQDALEAARDALLEAGDRETAAQAELSLSLIWWRRGQGDEADVHLARAEELVKGASSATAFRVLAHIARRRTIGGDPSEGLRLATEAMALAEGLPTEELRAHALATIGLAKIYLGDPTGVDDQIRALELAIAANLPVAGSIANSVAAATRSLPSTCDAPLRASTRGFESPSASAMRRGRVGCGHSEHALGTSSSTGTRHSRCKRSSLPSAMPARLTTSRAQSGASAGASVRHGETSPARSADYERALSQVRATNDPQGILPTLGTVARAFERTRTTGGSAGSRPRAGRSLCRPPARSPAGLVPRLRLRASRSGIRAGAA